MVYDEYGRRKTDAATKGQYRESRRIHSDRAMADLQDIDREKQSKLSRLRTERQARETMAREPAVPTEPAVPVVPTVPIVPTADLIAVVTAVREAQLVLASYIEPGKRNADQAMVKLLSILDRNDVVETVDRLEVELGIRIS